MTQPLSRRATKSIDLLKFVPGRRWFGNSKREIAVRDSDLQRLSHDHFH